MTPEDNILDALKKLKRGHYLHLPVMDSVVPVGLVDVMALTISMLTYLVRIFYCLMIIAKEEIFMS